MNRRPIALATLLLAVVACNGDDDTTTSETGSSETPSATESSFDEGTPTPEATTDPTPADSSDDQSDPTESPDDDSASTTAATACVAIGGNDRVGEIVAENRATVTVDCKRVSDGDAILGGSELVTNLTGDVRFSLAGAGCRLQPDGVVHVQPQPSVILRLDRGRLACSFGNCGTDAVVPVEVGSEVALMQCSIVELTNVPGELPNVWIDGGVVLTDSDVRQCRSVYGPGENIEFRSDGPIRNALPSAAVTARQLLDLPRAGDSDELFPGLGDQLVDGSARLAIDGEPIDSSDAATVPLLESVLAVDIDAVVDGVVVTDLLASPVLAPPMTAAPPTTTTTTTTTRPGIPQVTIAPPQVLLPVPAIGELRNESVLLRTPTGETVTVLWSPADGEIDRIVGTDLRTRIFEGSFGRGYERLFGTRPDYGAILPDLLEGRTSC